MNVYLNQRVSNPGISKDCEVVTLNEKKKHLVWFDGQNRKESGSFDFLGFTFYLGVSRHGAVIHNGLLHDESITFATNQKYPEWDHGPFVVKFSD